MSNPLQFFFSLGNRVTKGDPLRKAKFDYYLFSIVFLAFVGLTINYFYSFAQTLKFTSLMWGCILIVFCWFNYWGLTAFYGVYKNMKEMKEKITSDKVESVEDMLKEVKDGQTKRTRKSP